MTRRPPGTRTQGIFPSSRHCQSVRRLTGKRASNSVSEMKPGSMAGVFSVCVLLGFDSAVFFLSLITLTCERTMRLRWSDYKRAFCWKSPNPAKVKGRGKLGEIWGKAGGKFSVKNYLTQFANGRVTACFCTYPSQFWRFGLVCRFAQLLTNRAFSNFGLSL